MVRGLWTGWEYVTIVSLWPQRIRESGVRRECGRKEAIVMTPAKMPDHRLKSERSIVADLSEEQSGWIDVCDVFVDLSHATFVTANAKTKDKNFLCVEITRLANGGYRLTIPVSTRFPALDWTPREAANSREVWIPITESSKNQIRMGSGQEQ
jgi:hypothetical protein